MAVLYTFIFLVSLKMQAQLVSAVRSAISTASGPLLLDAGLELATKVQNASLRTSHKAYFAVCWMANL